MNKESAVSAPRKDAGITQRYGKIGISAVAAAARYQDKGKNDSTTAERSKIERGTSPRRPNCSQLEPSESI